MNAIAFGMKRALHGFLRVTRKPLASVGLTPARFDMLYALFARTGPGRWHHSIRQSDLRRELGVCPSVVSRMVRKLELLGLVTRARCPDDRRQIGIAITGRGWGRIYAAKPWLLRSVQRLVLGGICFGQHRDPFERLRHMDSLEAYLGALRREFFDTATLGYPWGHPDD
jgi:DNA-binding MarR family transcriptional regulator